MVVLIVRLQSWHPTPVLYLMAACNPTPQEVS